MQIPIWVLVAVVAPFVLYGLIRLIGLIFTKFPFSCMILFLSVLVALLPAPFVGDFIRFGHLTPDGKLHGQSLLIGTAVSLPAVLSILVGIFHAVGEKLFDD